MKEFLIKTFIGILLIILFGLMITACGYHSCPTYASCEDINKEYQNQKSKS